MEEFYENTQSKGSVDENSAAEKPKTACEKLTERTLTEDEFMHIFHQWLEPWILYFNECETASDTDLSQAQ